MIDKSLTLLTILALVVASLSAEAQSAGPVPTIGIIVGRPEASRAFEEGLRELGWVEGKTVTFERHVGTDYQKLSRFVAELTRIPVDVIYAGNSPATRAAMEATRTVPIITMSADPVGAGFVSSLARPGANITGLAIMNTELSGKRLELLVQALPTARRIALLTNPGNPATPLMRRETEARAKAIGVQILPFEASVPDRLADAMTTAAQQRPDALVVLGDPMFPIGDPSSRRRRGTVYLQSGNGGSSLRQAALWRTVPGWTTFTGARQSTWTGS